MTSKEYLQSIRDLYYEIEILKKRKSKISTPTRIKGISYDKICVMSSRDGSELEKNVVNTISELEKINKQIKKKTDKLSRLKYDATKKIMQIPEGQTRRFLIDYYVLCMSLKEINEEYRFNDEKSVYRLKGRALKKFKNVYKRC